MHIEGVSTMDDKIVLDAINGHMSLLSSLQSWMLVTAIATIYMAASSGDELDLKIVKAKRHNAAILVVTLYLVIMVAVLIAMTRVYGLLELLPSAKVSEAFSAIATQSWLLNPFSYFGNSFFPQFTTWVSLAGLLIVWAIVFASTSVITGSFQRLEYWFGAGFVALSAATLVAIQQIERLLVSKTAVINPGLSTTIESLRRTRLAISLWGGVAAVVVAVAVVAIIGRRATAAPNPGPPADR